jgi:Fe-Mn family superoxide dismutase
MPLKLPELPYEKDALAPYMSQETLEYHYGKHHNAYVKKTNELIKGTPFDQMDLETLVLNSEGEVFNNSAQVWNHNFFWQCLTPAVDNSDENTPTGKILDLINDRWDNFATFKQEFTKMAGSNFGAGWTWLVENQSGELEIRNTSNAQNPLVLHLTPLLTVDVWEHAYYIDYRNLRPDYLGAFWKLVNWEFVNMNLSVEKAEVSEVRNETFSDYMENTSTFS